MGKVACGKQTAYFRAMIEGRIGSGGRITVPLEVREALQLGAGDRLAYEIDGDRVILSRAASDDDEHGPHSMSDEDLRPIIEEALANLGGPTYSAEEVFAEIREHLETRRRRADAA